MSTKFQRLDPKTSSGWIQWDDCTEYVQALERLARAAIAKEEAEKGYFKVQSTGRAKAYDDAGYEYDAALEAVRGMVKP